MTAQFHIAIPPPQTPYTMKPLSRRAPLTPSTITPPQTNIHTTSATRPTCDTGSPPSATALLSKMNAGSRRSSPATTPTSKTLSDQYAVQTPTMEQWNARSWASQRQSDGYISFPDFEKYCQHYETSPQEQTNAKG